MSPVQVRALFFASYRELAGTDALTVSLAAPATVGALVRQLRASDGPARRLPERPTVAVNLRYAKLDSSIGEGDEVAFIPPVSGG